MYTSLTQRNLIYCTAIVQKLYIKGNASNKKKQNNCKRLTANVRPWLTCQHLKKISEQKQGNSQKRHLMVSKNHDGLGNHSIIIRTNMTDKDKIYMFFGVCFGKKFFFDLLLLSSQFLNDRCDRL